ncbi:hypothetical protein, partial [Nonomuraea sp. NPDC049504]|uniref:hypothetical protein n=1 Tax=Nonomuraea sp. NPDC049504 TaxID=3154729 RepID=UPI00344A715E
RGLADLEHLRQDALGADLAEIDDGDQDLVGVGQQWASVVDLGLLAWATADFEVALLGQGA